MSHDTGIIQGRTLRVQHDLAEVDAERMLGTKVSSSTRYGSLVMLGNELQQGRCRIAYARSGNAFSRTETYENT